MTKDLNSKSGNSILDDLISKAKKAQEIYSTFSQEQVDNIFKACAIAINSRRIPLAKMAVEETGMGVVEDKVIKNHFASEYIYNKFKNMKTCGIISEDTAMGMKKVAEPVGIIAGVVPTTNPTSTAAFKSLIALKTRNAIVFSPHPRAKKCTAEVCKIINRVAVEHGAPDGLIGCIEEPTVELSAALMSHPQINLILATGGPGMVKAAYSSGKPALGVGAGNTPAIIDETADIKMAVNSVIMSKTFDNGMICASEQTVVVVKSVYEEVKKEFLYRGAYLLNKDEKAKLSKVMIIDGALNAKIVGQPAYVIAKMAGITVPEETKILIGEASSISKDEAFSYEKLSPVLGMYKADNYDDAVEKAHNLIVFGGLGHTSVLYTDEDNQKERIKKFYEKMPTGRILINMPSSQGAIGDVYNFRLEPSLTLGCGSWGNNSTSENVGPKHLLNIKSVASRRENMLWYRVPEKIYLKRGSLDVALREYANKKRALIITDGPLFKLGVTDNVTKVLDDIGVKYTIFSDVKPDPTISTVRDIVKTANAFEPDVIIALGGGSPIDAGKIAWLLYENPEVKFEDIAMVFMDIRKRICDAGELGKKAQFVAIPTTSGTGSETTPFAVITDDATHIKYPITDYALTPDMAILDANLVMSMPRGLCAASGIDSLTHALEAYASICSTEFSNSNAEKAIKLIFKYLPASYKEGAENPVARENMHYAASLAGMAFANAFLGICHSLAHKLGAAFNIPHGIANALLICQVVKYNANEKPTKQGLFPQYKYPHARERYAFIADMLELGGKNDNEKVANLIKAINGLKKELDIPLSIKDYGVAEKDFMAKLDDIVEQAFNDQCTGANPVYPLMKELKQIYLDAYNGVY
ncbi:bifunctional acetaldehyde-CoA/alcohol dehydrogenase [Brachyspira pilosicoli]|uniref:bifunctional acetaldehyde-CoA/alcohol dehydrogenase n=1 Tax=Brachyspira pilosicoli TaxID=52584 RepID=UPI003003ECE2